MIEWPFNAGQRVGPVGIVNGQPVFTDDLSGAVVPLQIAESNEPLHMNPYFANVTAGKPDDWSDSFEVGGQGMTADPDGIFGTAGVILGVDAGVGTDFQTILSDLFTVNPADTVEVATWAHGLTGLPWLQLGLLTDPVDPSFIGTDAIDQRTERQELSAGFAHYVKSFTVPKGHITARMYAVVDSTAGEAVEALLSFTTTKRTGAASPSTDWDALPYATNWGDAGFGWTPGQYRRVDDDLHIQGLSARSISASGATATIATLPPLFWPPAIQPLGDAYYTAGGTSAATQLYLTATGNIVTSVSIPAGAYVAFNMRVSLL